MLKRLIESHHRNFDYQHSVIALTQSGKVGKQLQALGVEVRELHMISWLDIPRVLWQLVRLILAERPDIVQTWMYHSDLLGGLAAVLAGNKRVIWGIRGSDIPQRGLSSTQIVVTVCSWLSFILPRVIVCCAESARVAHVLKGYEKKKLVVIPNGYELSNFNWNPALRRLARSSFKFRDTDIIIGIVGRFDPLKDHENFIRAAAVVASKVERVKFLMIGRDIDSSNIKLNRWIDESGFADKFLLIGERSDVPECLAALDIFCLSSFKEGFPNVVCEAMAMNVPCVVTNVGDAADIVSNLGIVVSSRDSIALANALLLMIDKGFDERARLGKMARIRIEKNYSIKIASSKYEEIYKKILEN